MQIDVAVVWISQTAKWNYGKYICTFFLAKHPLRVDHMLEFCLWYWFHLTPPSIHFSFYFFFFLLFDAEHISRLSGVVIIKILTHIQFAGVIDTFWMCRNKTKEKNYIKSIFLNQIRWFLAKIQKKIIHLPWHLWLYIESVCLFAVCLVIEEKCEEKKENNNNKFSNVCARNLCGCNVSIWRNWKITFLALAD